MAQSPVDKSKDFIESGMTLITEYSSERYLQRKEKQENYKRAQRSLKISMDDYVEYLEDM